MNERSEQDARITRTARLRAISVGLSFALTPREVARAVIQHAVVAVEAKWCVVLRASEDGRYLELLGESGVREDDAGHFRTVQISRATPLGHAARTGDVIFVEDGTALAHRYALVSDIVTLREAPLLAVPLAIDGRTIGALGIGFGGAHDGEVRDYVLKLAGFCSQALDRARSYDSDVEARTRAGMSLASEALRTPLDALRAELRVLRLDARAHELGPPIEKLEGHVAELTRLVSALLDR